MSNSPVPLTKSNQLEIDSKVGVVQGVHLSGGCINNPWSIQDLPNYLSKLTYSERISLVSLLQTVANRIERDTGHLVMLDREMGTG
ncbi:MAG: hypothetical protein HQL69_10740 [Magnetococcales bacterium]|nr:hypothetical protein [Magnetococcales bacterium]